MTAVDLAAHVASLCDHHGITVVSHSRGGRSWRKSRKIAIRPVKSAITYAVAMHEIGHILGPDQSLPRLFAEAGAWAWAEENALVWCPQMNATRARCLRSYASHALEKHERGVRNAPRLPPNDHVFWTWSGVIPWDFRGVR